jgi:hypothetical protein
MQDLATDKTKHESQDLRAHGNWFLFLPLHLPDLSLIEQAVHN